METRETPEFYTGAPVDSDDLRFREHYLGDIWEALRTKHVVITAPRRTGKTSVMDHLKNYPRNDTAVVSVNVQDLDHPAEFFQTILDVFHDEHPAFFRDKLAVGWALLNNALGKVKEAGYGGFKVSLREGDEGWKENWRQHGTQFLTELRKHAQQVLIVVDELPDMLMNLGKQDPKTLEEFLAWWRTQRIKPAPKNDSVRWLIGGSVNLKGTLDSLGHVDLVNDIEDMPLPVLTSDQVKEFVNEMLTQRGVKIRDNVSDQVVECLGQPIPIFMQMATQDLYRKWKKGEKEVPLTKEDVIDVFDAMTKSSAAQDKLQHFYSRIKEYYVEPKQSAAYELLSKVSLSEKGLGRKALETEFQRVVDEKGIKIDAPAQKQLFYQLMLDLENDFYILEVEENVYDFSSGVLKLSLIHI